MMNLCDSGGTLCATHDDEFSSDLLFIFVYVYGMYENGNSPEIVEMHQRKFKNFLFMVLAQ